MSRRKSGGKTETLPQRGMRAPAIRPGITAATGSDRNKNDTERRGDMRGRRRKDVGTDAARRKLQRKLRFAFVNFTSTLSFPDQLLFFGIAVFPECC